MFRVDFPKFSLSRLSSRLFSMALMLALALSFGTFTPIDANAAGKRVHKSGGHHSRSGRVSSRRSRGPGSYRSSSKRTYRKRHGKSGRVSNRPSRGLGGYRASSRRTYGGNHYRYGPSRRYGVGHWARNSRSSGVRMGHYRLRSNYRGNHNYYGNYRRSGVRYASNYNPGSYSVYEGGYYNQPTVNGLGINEFCPTNHSCGLRVYENNTGPRIIVLGKASAGKKGKKPAVSKVGAPKVIKYKNRVN